MPRSPRPPGPNDRVVIVGTIKELHPTHLVLGSSKGARLFFPPDTSGWDSLFKLGQAVTVTIARLGSRFIIEKVSRA